MKSKKFSEVKTIEDKLNFIVENEGCELADGVSGLQTFMQYTGYEYDERLAPIIEEVWESFVECMEEEEKDDEFKFSDVSTGEVFTFDNNIYFKLIYSKEYRYGAVDIHNNVRQFKSDEKVMLWRPQF